MRTNVRESSIENYHINQAELINQKKAEAIAAYVKMMGWVTRRMIAQALGYDTATVSGRVNVLVEEKTLVDCEESEKRPCPITGRRVLWVNHKDNMAGQRDMFGGVQ